MACKQGKIATLSDTWSRPFLGLAYVPNVDTSFSNLQWFPKFSPLKLKYPLVLDFAGFNKYPITNEILFCLCHSDDASTTLYSIGIFRERVAVVATPTPTPHLWSENFTKKSCFFFIFGAQPPPLRTELWSKEGMRGCNPPLQKFLDPSLYSTYLLQNVYVETMTLV